MMIDSVAPFSSLFFKKDEKKTETSTHRVLRAGAVCHFLIGICKMRVVVVIIITVISIRRFN